jgi:hypothetical protein
MSTEAVTEVIADYDRAVAYAWDEMKRKVEAGDPLHKEEVEEKLSQEFVWPLLKRDLIEKLGRIRASSPSEAEEKLVQRVSRRLAVPLPVAQREIGRLVQQGMLKCEGGSKSFIWKWS